MHLSEIEKTGQRILKSICECFPKRKNGESGYSFHTLAKYWEGSELSLAKFVVASLEERIIRPLKDTDNATTVLQTRKAMLLKWRDIVNFLEEAEYPDVPPRFFNLPEFHSGIRSLLLDKDCKIQTFKKWKNGDYPDHACTRNLLPKKGSWVRKDYLNLWEFFGRPEPAIYNNLGWTDEISDLRYFYRLDRVPQMLWEISRKVDRPMVSFLLPKIKEKLDE